MVEAADYVYQLDNGRVSLLDEEEQSILTK